MFDRGKQAAALTNLYMSSFKCVVFFILLLMISSLINFALFCGDFYLNQSCNLAFQSGKTSELSKDISFITTNDVG